MEVRSRRLRTVDSSAVSIPGAQQRMPPSIPQALSNPAAMRHQSGGPVFFIEERFRIGMQAMQALQIATSGDRGIEKG